MLLIVQVMKKRKVQVMYKTMIIAMNVLIPSEIIAMNFLISSENTISSLEISVQLDLTSHANLMPQMIATMTVAVHDK